MNDRYRKAVYSLGGLVAGLALSVTTVAAFGIATNHPTKVHPSELGAAFDVTVLYFEDSSPCGSGDQHAGCFRWLEPDVIYIKAGMDPEVERSVTLHEIGHVLQYRAGVPGTECEADEIARLLGATWFGYDC